MILGLKRCLIGTSLPSHRNDVSVTSRDLVPPDVSASGVRPPVLQMLDVPDSTRPSASHIVISVPTNAFRTPHRRTVSQFRLVLAEAETRWNDDEGRDETQMHWNGEQQPTRKMLLRESQQNRDLAAVGILSAVSRIEMGRRDGFSSSSLDAFFLQQCEKCENINAPAFPIWGIPPSFCRPKRLRLLSEARRHCDVDSASDGCLSAVILAIRPLMGTMTQR